MKAAQINQYGGSEIVEINGKAARPTITEGKVIVEVHAAGVNPVDWKIRQGYLAKMAPLSFPATLGGDFSGVVTEVGKGVSDLNLGDEVYGQAGVLLGGSGSFAEYALVSAQTIARKPKSISYAEAAALPLAGVSALQALIEHINLLPGQKILIHGGAGGIGSFALQLAKHLGAYVATTVSGGDETYVKNLGASEVIDYKTEHFEDKHPDYDAVFDTIGGETYKKSFKVLKPGGVIVSMLEQPNTELIAQYGVKAIAQFTQVTTERLSKLAEFVDKRVIRIHVDKTFPLDQVGEALAYLKTGLPKGKVVVKIK